MDDSLEKLVRDLRAETCPSDVMARVARRIARDADTTRGWRRVLAWRLAGVVLVVALGAGAGWRWIWPRHESARESMPDQTDRAVVLHQTQGALVFIGQTLIEAGIRAENALLNEAAPPLFERFRIAKNKLTHPL